MSEIETSREGKGLSAIFRSSSIHLPTYLSSYHTLSYNTILVDVYYIIDDQMYDNLGYVFTAARRR